MENHLRPVLNYFSYFSYRPTFDEIRLFYPVKISRKKLADLLKKGVREAVQSSPRSESMFRASGQVIDTIPQYSIRRYLSALKALPFYDMVGITGASALRGYTASDDLDLFIVTRPGFLWVSRFVAVALAKLLRIHSGNGVCLNLFFDGRDLDMPDEKKNSYIAHEILQMKPVFDKRRVYERFLWQNRWVLTYFPNAPVPRVAAKRPPVPSRLILLADTFFRKMQLPHIQANKAAFRITETQMWLFKTDFEKKLKRKGLVL